MPTIYKWEDSENWKYVGRVTRATTAYQSSGDSEKVIQSLIDGCKKTASDNGWKLMKIEINQLPAVSNSFIGNLIGKEEYIYLLKAEFHGSIIAITTLCASLGINIVTIATALGIILIAIAVFFAVKSIGNTIESYFGKRSSFYYPDGRKADDVSTAEIVIDIFFNNIKWISILGIGILFVGGKYLPVIKDTFGMIKNE